MAMAPEGSRSLFSRWDLAAAGGFLALAMFYSRVVRLLPDPVPTHFDALGHANGWTAKAQLPGVIFGLALVPWLALLLMGAVLRVVPDKPGNPAEALQPLRGLLGLGMAMLMGACLAIPLFGIQGLLIGVVAFFLCLAAGVAFLIRASVAALRGSGSGGGGRVNAECYRAGLFYVNAKDPRLWVEKPVGVGWTLNYARPAAFWLTALLLSPLLLALAATLRGGHW